MLYKRLTLKIGLTLFCWSLIYFGLLGRFHTDNSVDLVRTSGSLVVMLYKKEEDGNVYTPI